LERQKAALREQARHQRLKMKGMVQVVEAKNEALQLQCSAAEVGQQKLTRALESERTKGQSLLEQTERLVREREFLQNELHEKDDALGVAQEAAEFVEAEQMKLADARKVETKNHCRELKVLEKQKLTVDNKLEALTQRVTCMDKQLAKLQEDLRTAISVRLVTLSFKFVLSFSKLTLLSFLCFRLQDKRKAEAECRKAKLILKTTKKDLERVMFQLAEEKDKYSFLEEKHLQVTDTVADMMEKNEELCHIRDNEHRGKPLKESFVRHCRTLLATGASARSVREQLFLNGAFFLSEQGYATFSAGMPSLRYFQYQREGMGNESLTYSFVSIAKCDEVYQWGFDETSLNGIPTLNQWCRIKENGEYRTVTIECAGLLPGSTSTRVAEHVRATWERGQQAVALLRSEVGAEADELVPLVNGGVTLTKLRGAMHDTCNAANLVAKKVRLIRDDIGKEMHGAEKWAAMQEHGSGWQDFLCANHSRNLHFDAFSRLYMAYVKDVLGEGLAVAKARSGGRLRIEADGESFLRSICKLTHVGPKQYEKGASYPFLEWLAVCL
jgi:hypothetical protein